MRELGKAIAEIVRGRNALLVASTDLSHFYTARVAKSLDETMIQAITALNPEGIFQAESERRGFACGKGALAAVIWAAKEMGANQAHHLRYANSGDVTGDNREVVGYEAAVITRN